jgi:chromate transport protein ChrA
MNDRLREIALGFLKVGATAYGGPAIMGVMQADSHGLRRRLRAIPGLPSPLGAAG